MVRVNTIRDDSKKLSNRENEAISNFIITNLSSQPKESYVTRPMSFVEYRLRLFKKSTADKEADERAIKWLDNITEFNNLKFYHK